MTRARVVLVDAGDIESVRLDPHQGVVFQLRFGYAVGFATKDFMEFRGHVCAFDAAGRLMKSVFLDPDDKAHPPVPRFSVHADYECGRWVFGVREGRHLIDGQTVNASLYFQGQRSDYLPFSNKLDGVLLEILRAQDESRYAKGADGPPAGGAWTLE